MLSYLIVIISLKKFENRLHTGKKTDWHEEKQMDTKTKKNNNNNNTFIRQFSFLLDKKKNRLKLTENLENM